jgi:hypothetical protein
VRSLCAPAGAPRTLSINVDEEVSMFATPLGDLRRRENTNEGYSSTHDRAAGCDGERGGFGGYTQHHV